MEIRVFGGSARAALPWPEGRNFLLGDIVLVYDPDQSRTLWKMGRVEELLSRYDGKVRGVSLRVQSGSKTILIRHPTQHLYPLEV